MLRARPLIALPDGTVIAGNQRLRAAQQLGWSTVPTIHVDLDPARARLWALRDNNQFGEWDEPALADLLNELAVGGVDLVLAGFADQELNKILDHLAPVVDPDAVGPVDEGASDSAAGSIYELGPHRLACGDARDPQLIGRLLGDVRADVLWTDPPYGVGYIGKTPRKLTIENDDENAGDLLHEMLSTIDPFLAGSARFYIASPAGPAGTAFRRAIDSVGWRLHQSLVWVKNSPVLGHSDYQYQHEDFLYGFKAGEGRPGRGRHRGSRWYGDNAQRSVFFVDRPARSEEHPTMKPVALIAAQLSNSSRRGDAVVDPFAGSGSTLIACEQLDRRCFAVELDPAYCDVIRRRYQGYIDGRAA